MIKLFFIFFSLFFMIPTLDLQAMEEKPEQSPVKRRKVQGPACISTLKNLSIEAILEAAPELENLSELLASMPEEVQEETKEAARQKFPLGLHNAKSKKEIETFLTLGLDPNVKDQLFDNTALNALIYNDQLDEAIYLIDLIRSKNPDAILTLDVTSPNTHDITSLQLAIEHKNKALVDSIITILQEQYRINSINNYNKGWSAFTLAIRYMPELVDEFIELGANVNAANKKNETPLWVAVEYNNIAAVRSLLNEFADPNGKPLADPLNQAIDNNNTDAVRLLLEAGAKVLIGPKNRSLRGNNLEIKELIQDYYQKQIEQKK